MHIAPSLLSWHASGSDGEDHQDTGNEQVDVEAEDGNHTNSGSCVSIGPIGPEDDFSDRPDDSATSKKSQGKETIQK